MKKAAIIIILAIVALAFGCAGVAAKKVTPPELSVAEKSIPIETSIDGECTYEGRLDPADFNNWAGVPYQKGPYGMVYILQNPRQYATIKFVFAYIAANDSLVAFAYIEDNKLRYFGIMQGSHYEEMDIPEKVREEIKQNLLIIEGAFERI